MFVEEITKDAGKLKPSKVLSGYWENDLGNVNITPFSFRSVFATKKNGAIFPPCSHYSVFKQKRISFECGFSHLSPKTDLITFCLSLLPVLCFLCFLIMFRSLFVISVPPFLGVQITVMHFCLAPFLFSPVFASVFF